ncbi:MAG: phosphoenolpyruvate synthase [Candidatus Komeilibacteria bacterium CG_4_10_14_0_2_um_filter_37_10]|uniref:Phosphoenolpyruvate synthase n=1 Tax=Candidatus Komeilibacteria bacterium CG_4_10_14_0_2_um_filter_37_10 TaxID=1974470 RepID=A0A2M7VFL8_9BACT|nr:MAG: phosphoenolpyruvate synthase [Candidatus Komeilibacteria bacterium CG_4_10_14_0_2_um_filter_37_10]
MKVTKKRSAQNVLWFKGLTIKDVGLVGGKNASLGEMYSKLTQQGVRIPNGFAITATAYRQFLEDNNLFKTIKDTLRGVDIKNIKQLSGAGAKIRKLILQGTFSDQLKNEIAASYQQLSKFYQRTNIDVAVRSSATAEDLPSASFAGQQESYLNIVGIEHLLLAVKQCMSSLFTDRAISYRQDRGFDHQKIALSVTVQAMVRSDLACSGVMFSIDTESGFENAVVINGSWGLGEMVVKGSVTPDEYFVFKTTLGKKDKSGKEYRPIIGKEVGSKLEKMIYQKGGNRATEIIKTTSKERNNYVLSDAEILQLAKWTLIIEKHYGRPMDIEWARDGRTNKLFIVQARPETVRSQQDKNVLEEYTLGQRGKLLIFGSAVGSKIGQGSVQVIKDVEKIEQFQAGNVLVTEMTDPDWEPIMKRAAAIVTNSGGRTCHAAIVSRELGIPCIVGTGRATEVIKNHQSITVSCAEGEQGNVYQGLLKYQVKKINLQSIGKTKTKIMMNVGEPRAAFLDSMIPNDGVGLAREEFIINNFIKIHPLALLNHRKLKDQKAKREIARLTANYQNKSQFFVDKLAEGVGRIAAAFYPKDVIVRLSDFKSNEYANLIGGREFEPQEGNPMIGWRGASRYYDHKYLPAFKLECAALKKVREVMGLRNVKIMIPFCRTIAEGKKVQVVMAEHGLKRGVDGLQVYVMCEIPANVILAKEFCQIFDGFSIGSNDLTQLALGVDRDSALVSHVYNERNEAVTKLIEQIIKVAHQYKRKVGICGQAPSDFPEFAQMLVKLGIDSISLIPDTVIKTTLKVLETEKRKKKK